MTQRQCPQLCAPGFVGTLRLMKKLFGFAGVAALLVAAGALIAPEADARSCYRIWAQADGSGSSYRHRVYVENDCDYWLRCSLWTDVNPRPPIITSVAPDATEYEETNARSDVSDPQGFGSCREK